MRKTLAFAACLLMSAVASAQSDYITQQAKLACGDPSVQFDVQRAPGPSQITPSKDKAVVYILEPGQASLRSVAKGVALAFVMPAAGVAFGGDTTTYRIGLDGKWLGAIRWKGQYTPFWRYTSSTAFLVPTGLHHLCIQTQADLRRNAGKVVLIELRAEAGQTYYYNMDNLEAIDPDEAQYLLSTSSPVVSFSLAGGVN